MIVKNGRSTLRPYKSRADTQVCPYKTIPRGRFVQQNFMEGYA
jgi:hypothetical protein